MCQKTHSFQAQSSSCSAYVKLKMQSSVVYLLSRPEKEKKQRPCLAFLWHFIVQEHFVGCYVNIVFILIFSSYGISSLKCDSKTPPQCLKQIAIIQQIYEHQHSRLQGTTDKRRELQRFLMLNRKFPPINLASKHIYHNVSTFQEKRHTKVIILITAIVSVC